MTTAGEPERFAAWQWAAETVNWLWHRRANMTHDTRTWRRALDDATRREEVYREMLFRSFGKAK